MTRAHSEDRHESLQQQNPMGSLPQNDEPLLKKPRLSQEHERSADTPTESSPSLFLNLPIELLAEILILTESPKHVLAVARSSKFFCATLLDPSSTYIWRTVRKICKPNALPEPFSIFTEASYAAFVFDGGRCEACKKQTDLFYTSFALRLRLCRNMDCINTFFDKLSETSASSSWRVLVVPITVPHAENNPSFLTHPNAASGIRIYRKEDWHRDLDRWIGANASTEYLANTKVKVKYISDWMGFCTTLSDWKDMYQAVHLSIKGANEKLGKDLAKQHGWEYWDLMNCTPYGAVHRHRTRLLENTTELDYNSLVPQIEETLVRVSENRKRRSHEAMYKQSRQDVKQHYNRLRSLQPAIVLPSLAAFRELPVIEMLQGSPNAAGASGVSLTLRKTLWVRDRLDLELKKWVQNAKTQLGTVLGYPNWKTASTVVLHPCDRVTAWFRCKYCHRLPLKHLNNQCLDFAGACAHECVGISKAQKRHNKPWDPDKFVKDDKASAVMLQLLDLCGGDGTRAEARPIVEKLGSRIVCLSCNPPLLMGPESVVGHSHRHSDMKIRLSPEPEAKCTFEAGLVKRLMGLELRARALQAMKVYGCRHCSYSETESRRQRKKGRTCKELVKGNSSRGSMDRKAHEDNQTQHASKSGHDETQAGKLYSGAYTFHGLRSHLSATHEIKDIRDEDLFCYKPLDWTCVKNVKPS